MHADRARSSRRVYATAYQDALREPVDAKTKGRATTPRTIAEPPKVINLMEALKRSLAQNGKLATMALS